MEEPGIAHSSVGMMKFFQKSSHFGAVQMSAVAAQDWGGVCALTLHRQIVCGVICSQNWVFIWLLFECCLKLLLNVMSLRWFFHYFLYMLYFFKTTPKALIKHLQCMCSSFCICHLMAFTVSATIVFHFFTWFSSPCLCDMVLSW